MPCISFTPRRTIVADDVRDFELAHTLVLAVEFEYQVFEWSFHVS